jgi:SAM-dependent methyltransferase
MSVFTEIDGYVADSVYPSKFHDSFQVPFIDAILALKGIVPPRYRHDHFTVVDLGCGDGLGLILSAASHPQGYFIGVDVMPEHVANGQAAIKAIGLTNIELRCGSFSDISAQVDGKADYVTSQGVLAWISPENRTALLDVAACWLKPGGVFCVGYNAFPGWTDVMSFQALVRATALEQEGDSSSRFLAALDHLKKTTIISDSVLEWVDDLMEKITGSYFAHEYLNAYWQPCWSGDVIRSMGERNCAYVGQSAQQYIRDDLYLMAAWREMLAGFSSVPAHEIALDILIQRWFRRDIYVKMPALGFDVCEQDEYRLHSWWGLMESDASEIGMTSSTLAGEINFDNAAAYAILKTLENSPQTLAQVVAQSGLDAVDIFNSVDALFMANRIVPLDAPVADDKIEKANLWFAENNININGCASVYGAQSA